MRDLKRKKEAQKKTVSTHICLSISVYPYAGLSVRQTISLSVCLSVCMYVCLSVYLSIFSLSIPIIQGFFLPLDAPPPPRHSFPSDIISIKKYAFSAILSYIFNSLDLSNACCFGVSFYNHLIWVFFYYFSL